MEKELQYPFFSLSHAFINDDSKLSTLYAKYLDTLFEATRMFWDSYASLSEAKSEEAENYKMSSALTLQNKLLVWQSFISIINSAKESIKIIDEFENDYDSDLIHYAAQKRIDCIDKFGGEEEDFNKDGDIRFSTDEKDIAFCSLKCNLSNHIQIEASEFRGEKVGSPIIDDLEYTNLFVKNATDFDIFKFFRQNGHNIRPHTMLPDGTMKPLTLADEIELEINKDIANQSVIDAVAKTLEYGREISNKLNSAPTTGDPSIYFEIRTMLKNLLNLVIKF